MKSHNKFVLISTIIYLVFFYLIWKLTQDYEFFARNFYELSVKTKSDIIMWSVISLIIVIVMTIFDIWAHKHIEED